jgi:hypothetical protein
MQAFHRGALALAALITLTGCFDRGGDIGPVDQPETTTTTTTTTVVDPPFRPYCENYDYHISPTEVEVNSPECGYNPPPAGTPHDSYCEGYTQVWVYNDGAYGFYEERTPNDTDCGYIPPRLDVVIDNEYGDRFKPVIVYVDYTVQGEPADWTYEVPLGKVTPFTDRLEIYGDGERHEDLTLTINGQQFLYQLYPEPRCGKVDLHTDCQGYEYTGDPDGYIYYGEDDDQIVEWSLGYIAYDNTLEVDEFVQSTQDDGVWREASKMVERANRIYEAAGVHIRYVLEPTAVGYGRYWDNDGHTKMARRIGTADLSLGRGITCPNTGGCAHVNRYFKEGTGFTLSGTISTDSVYTALHELGHTVGLAHGPDNVAYAREGYIWPDFGHGHSTEFCDNVSDLMSYRSNGYTHNNSLLTCDNGWPAGSREYADSAYHLNRVRYDVSMVGLDPDAPPAYIDEIPEMGPLILD